MERKGRLNLTQFLKNGTVKKTGLIKEENRPYRLKREAWALGVAKSQGLNVPKVLDYFLDAVGNEVLILEKIEGNTLDKQKVEIREKALSSIGQQMMRLSNVSKRYGWIDPDKLTGVYETWELFLLSFAKVYGKRLVDANLLNEKRLQKVINKINDSNLSLSFSYLIHRDIKLSNIIYSDDGNVWIIDWENAILGDPLFEIAVFGARNGHGCLWRELLRGYSPEIYKSNHFLHDLYESLALIGLISFLFKYQLDFKDKIKRLNLLIGN